MISPNIEIKLKETDKTYVLDLIRIDARYSPAYIEMLFAANKKAIIHKNKSNHAMRIWSDRDFTIYPFQGGIPFCFKLMEVVKKNVGT